MRLNSTLAHTLHSQMHIYLQQLEELLDTLEQERKAMTKKEYEGLARILEHKNNLLAEVEHFDQALNNSLIKIIKKPTQHNFKTLLQEYEGPLANGLKAQWTAIEKIVTQCKKANLINGMVVAQTQQYYTRLTAILRNKDPDSSTYSRNGRQSLAQGSGGRLGQA